MLWKTASLRSAVAIIASVTAPVPSSRPVKTKTAPLAVQFLCRFARGQALPGWRTLKTTRRSGSAGRFSPQARQRLAVPRVRPYLRPAEHETTAAGRYVFRASPINYHFSFFSSFFRRSGFRLFFSFSFIPPAGPMPNTAVAFPPPPCSRYFVL